MLSAEEARLRSLIQRLVLLSLASAPAACGTKSPTSTSPSVASDGGTDATAPSTSADGGSDSAALPASDASDGDDAESDAGDVSDATGGDGGDDSEASTCLPVQRGDGPEGGAPPSNCSNYTLLPCGLEPDAAVEGCNLLLTYCAELCPAKSLSGTLSTCNVFECDDAGTIPAGPLNVECIYGGPNCNGIVGRRPDGLCEPRARSGGDDVAAWLADSARLEAASVHAFERFGAELSTLGAPRALVRAAERSARDEVRHARVTRRLARRRGAEPERVVVKRSARARSLEAFALENAIEGCVRETFGALVATLQSVGARDAEVRAAMLEIARDETRHAALAWAVARWVEGRLDADARRRVARAMRSAVDNLRCEVRALPAHVARELGLPGGAAGAALVDAFAASLQS